MNLLSSIHAEVSKTKRSYFSLIHLSVPLLGVIVFYFYFIYYPSSDELNKLSQLCDITSVFFPLLISIVVGINIMIEEKASHFQNLFTIPHKKTSIISKVLLLYGYCIIALTLLFGLFYIIAKFSNNIGDIPLILIFKIIVCLSLGNFLYYIWHLFLNLKFSLSVSLSFGIVETLILIFFSNITVEDIYFLETIPFGWSVCLTREALYNLLMDGARQWGINLIIAIIIFCGFIMWFNRWEGRKNND